MRFEQDEAAAVRKGNLDDYSSFKSRVLLTTAGLVVGGGVVASATKGVNVAYPFATGGAIGILYQWLLQKGVDLVKPQPEAAQQYGKVGSTPPEVLLALCSLLTLRGSFLFVFIGNSCLLF